MTLPTTGPLSASAVNVELGKAANSSLALGSTAVRTLAGVASGPLAMSALRGKSAAPQSFTFVAAASADGFNFGYNRANAANGVSQGSSNPNPSVAPTGHTIMGIMNIYFSEIQVYVVGSLAAPPWASIKINGGTLSYVSRTLYSGITLLKYGAVTLNAGSTYTVTFT